MQPFVTIILPIRNEGDYIKDTINAIRFQDYAHDQIEILVVDGMSTDNTRDVIREFQLIDKRIQLIDNPLMIVPTGLNKGIIASRGDVIIRVDGHTLINSDYISKCIEVLFRTNADNCGGRMTAVGTTTFGRAVALATSTPFGVGNSKFHYSNIEEEVDSVYLGAWPMRIFGFIGLFDEELVRDQDDEFNYRLKKAGGKIILNPDIKSQYFTRSNPKHLFKQYFQYGFWKVRVFQKHPLQLSLRQFIPPTFVVSLILTGLFALLLPDAWVMLASIILLYFVVDLIVTITHCINGHTREFFALLVTFPIIHISYGIGFLGGLIYFWNRWGGNKRQKPE